MRVDCDKCGASIKAEDINIHLGIAKCSYCDSVVNILNNVKGEGVPQGGDTTLKPEVSMPEKITLEKHGNDLYIEYSWMNPMVYFLLFFCIGWDAFLIFWYSMAFGDNVDIIMIIFPIAHVAVGIGLTYFVVASFVNKTHFTIQDGWLFVQHKPLPWKGNLSLDVKEIKQIFCKENISQNKNGTSRSYDVHYVTQGNMKKKLISGLSSPDLALYIEQELERHLKIMNQDVHGEMSV